MPGLVVSEHRAPLPTRDRAIAVGFGLWMIVGLFLDGWAHDELKPEGFFTPWHAVLYSGFAAAGLSALLVARRSHRPGEAWTATLPAGHGLTLAALAAFGVGAVSDLVWHEAFGVEVGVEALLSPTHLLLLASGLLALSAPVRAAWASIDDLEDASLRAFLPTVLSVALLVALFGFFLLYLSPFINDAAGRRFVPSGVPHEHPSNNVAELQQLLGIASILLTTVLLAVPILVMLRRWRPPAGSFTVLVGVVVLFFVGLSEFDQAPLLVVGVVGGATADYLWRRVSAWLAVGTAMTCLWLSYFAVYELTEGGVEWGPELWAGTAVLAGLLAAGIGLVAAASPRPTSSALPEPRA